MTGAERRSGVAGWMASRNPTILFSLLEETDGAGLVRLDDDYETSRRPSSRLVLVEAGLDASPACRRRPDPGRDAASWCPPARRCCRRRGIVGVHGLAGTQGVIAAPEGFGDCATSRAVKIRCLRRWAV